LKNPQLKISTIMRLLYIVHDMTTWPSLARDLNSKLAFWVWKFFRNSILSKLEFRISDSSRSILLETIHSDWIILILGSAICKSVSRDLENVKIAAEHCTSASTESIWQETQIFDQSKEVPNGSESFRIIFVVENNVEEQSIPDVLFFSTKMFMRKLSF